MVNTALVDRKGDQEICKKISCQYPAVFYHNLYDTKSAIDGNLISFTGNFISFTEIEVSNLVKVAIEQLPEAEEFTDISFEVYFYFCIFKKNIYLV